jgi:radical SAM/Cys-rich protein
MTFDEKIKFQFPDGLSADGIRILQLNIGRKCNLSCTHCHLNCSPDRSEMMSRAVMGKVLNAAGALDGALADITGGAPEMHPDLEWFILELIKCGLDIQVRTNLSILAEDRESRLIDFFARNSVRLVASMPCYLEDNVDAQRGSGTYSRNIEAIKQLNTDGYGRDEALPLNLVYNPGGAFLPGPQSELETAYKEQLHREHGIEFTNLIAIANMPVGRFNDLLERSGEKNAYMSLLTDSFNPATLPGLMCRHQVCIDWDGSLYDCDFNLAEKLLIDHGAPDNIEAFDIAMLEKRTIVTGEHCFGCTAGSGSSCSGSLTS